MTFLYQVCQGTLQPFIQVHCLPRQTLTSLLHRCKARARESLNSSAHPTQSRTAGACWAAAQFPEEQGSPGHTEAALIKAALAPNSPDVLGVSSSGPLLQAPAVSDVCSEPGTFPPAISLLLSGTSAHSAAQGGRSGAARFGSDLPHPGPFEEQRHKSVQEQFWGPLGLVCSFCPFRETH